MYEGKRIPYGFWGYKAPSKLKMFEMDSPQAQRLFALCDNPMEKEIATLLFIDGLKAEKVAKAVGYSERQIYRIKKKLKERMHQEETKREDAKV